MVAESLNFCSSHRVNTLRFSAPYEKVSTYRPRPSVGLDLRCCVAWKLIRLQPWLESVLLQCCLLLNARLSSLSLSLRRPRETFGVFLSSSVDVLQIIYTISFWSVLSFALPVFDFFEQLVFGLSDFVVFSNSIAVHFNHLLKLVPQPPSCLISLFGAYLLDFFSSHSLPNEWDMMIRNDTRRFWVIVKTLLQRKSVSLLTHSRRECKE